MISESVRLSREEKELRISVVLQPISLLRYYSIKDMKASLLTFGVQEVTLSLIISGALCNAVWNSALQS